MNKFISRVSSLKIQICKKKSMIIDKRTKEGHTIQYPTRFNCFKTAKLANGNHEIHTFSNEATLINEIRRRIQISMQQIGVGKGNTGKQAAGRGKNDDRIRRGRRGGAVVVGATASSASWHALSIRPAENQAVGKVIKEMLVKV